MSSTRFAFNKSLMAVLCCVLFAAAAWGQSAPASIPATKQAISPATGPATAATEEVTISGKVVDAEGKSVEGADVQVHFIRRFDYGAPTRVGSGSSRSDGSFDFTVSITSEMQVVKITAKKAGAAIGWATYIRPEDNLAGQTAHVITLGKPGSIEGLVVDDAGDPVANAVVRAWLADSSLNNLLFVDQLDAVSDNKGRFRIEDIPADCLADFMVTAAGKARIVTRAGAGSQFGQYRPGQGGIKITLPSECRISGMILDEKSGKPIPGVSLAIIKENDAGTFPATRISDANGHFVFDHLLAGRHRIALPPSFSEMSDWVFEPVSVDAVAAAATAPSASRPASIRIEASKGGIAEILVVDAASGHAIPKASVSVRRKDAGAAHAYFQTISNQAGSARLRLLPGTWTIGYAQAQGFQSIQDMPEGPAIGLNVVEGQTSRTKIELKPLPRYSGIVKDSSGQVVEGATVHVFGDYSAAACITDKEGRFTVSTGQSYGGPISQQAPAIIIRHAPRNLAAVTEVDGAAKQIDATLEPASTLCGVVTSEDGKPIANAMVSLSITLGRIGSGLDRTPIKTNGQGRFEIPAVPTDQRYHLVINAEGYGQFQLSPGKIEISPGRLEMPPIVLPTADQSVSGVVVDAEDKGVAGARVRTYGNNQPNRDAVTDKDGKFEITKLVAGPLILNAWYDDPAAGVHEYANASASGGDKDIKLVLRELRNGRVASSAEARRSLLNKPLPKLEELGLKADGELAPGKPILICFFDMENRSSRRAVLALAAKAAELDSKGMVVVLIHTGSGDEQAVKSWVQQNKVSFPVGLAGSDDAKRRSAQAIWGADALPWLILADSKHQVQAEGFAMEQLDQILTKLTQSDR